MIVYLLLEFYVADGCDIIGIYASEKLANNELNERKDINKGNKYVSWQVTEHEIKYK